MEKILLDWLNEYYFDRCSDHLKKLYDKKILKEFSMMTFEGSTTVWASWQEFGTHKNVTNWVLIEGGYAVGFNENVSTGYSYPKVKLTQEQVEKYLAHTKNYEQYYNI